MTTPADAAHMEAVRAAERERWARICDELLTYARNAPHVPASAALAVLSRRLRSNDAPDKAPGQDVPWGNPE